MYKFFSYNYNYIVEAQCIKKEENSKFNVYRIKVMKTMEKHFNIC